MKRKSKYKAQPKIMAVDLFCGAGGLTRGLKDSGIDVRLGVDIDAHCEYPYKVNNSSEFILQSVADVTSRELSPFRKEGELFLLAGCAPCQTFSTYNKKANKADSRWGLLREFARLIEESSPDLVTMENVPGLEDQPVFKDFLDCLKSNKFSYSYEVVDCSDYGLPQSRKRLVLLASRMGMPKIIRPKQFYRGNKKTVGEAILHLRKISHGESDPSDPLHASSRLSSINLERIRHSKPGGTWKDWPEHLLLDCHRRELGKGYGSVYGRMRVDAPAPTITTQFFGYGNGRFGHPSQRRALSLREGAILQGFPQTYKFFPDGASVQKKVAGRLIGNSVPVVLGKVIGKSLIKHIKEVS